jgi:hypothetical protein
LAYHLDPPEHRVTIIRQTGMKIFLPLIVLLTVCGCSASRHDAQVTPDAPSLYSHFRCAQDTAFSGRDRDIITAVQRYLADSDKRPKGASEDAYYRVRRMGDGYDVFVIYVTGYKGTQPQFTPCVHNELFLRNDGTVTKVLTGPACWP